MTLWYGSGRGGRTSGRRLFQPFELPEMLLKSKTNSSPPTLYLVSVPLKDDLSAGCLLGFMVPLIGRSRMTLEELDVRALESALVHMW